ncbi:hypothetical protein ABNQ39_00465 (plasmid) [Azospirillum sp. A26]|uniref:hypothetical protein n=1 Tax=Azospirillum sp. A26 TaxID=3160607 RepID=UPI00366EA51D
MSDPIVPQDHADLRVTVPQPDVVGLLVEHACNALGIAGEMDGRQQGVAALVKTIRDTFGR